MARQGVAAAKWHTPFLNAREEEIYKVGEIGEQMHAGVAVQSVGRGDFRPVCVGGTSTREAGG